MRDGVSLDKLPSRVLVRSVLALVVLQAGCGPRAPIVLPTGSGTPLAEFASAFDTAMAPCRQVRTMEVALAVNARRGDSTLRGDVLGALARPASVRLVGVAPFGGPSFELVSTPSGSVLLLPRDRQVVRTDDAGALLEALTGLPLEPDDLRAVLTGCVVPDPRGRRARQFDDGWVGVEADGPATIYLRTVEDVPVVVAGLRPRLTVEYANHVRGLPRHVRVVVTGTGPSTDLTARLSQVNINVELHPDVFTADVGVEFTPLTLDQFRRGEAPLIDESSDPDPSSE